jgi:hypothetical protein
MVLPHHSPGLDALLFIIWYIEPKLELGFLSVVPGVTLRQNLHSFWCGSIFLVVLVAIARLRFIDSPSSLSIGIALALSSSIWTALPSSLVSASIGRHRLHCRTPSSSSSPMTLPESAAQILASVLAFSWPRIGYSIGAPPALSWIGFCRRRPSIDQVSIEASRLDWNSILARLVFP